jgi:plasmid stability protein
MVERMGHIQIRNVPEDIHRTMKARAAKEGLSLSEYLLRDIVDRATHPTIAELSERISRREPVRGDFSAADIIREEREARDQHIVGH